MNNEQKYKAAIEKAIVDFKLIVSPFGTITRFTPFDLSEIFTRLEKAIQPPFQPIADGRLYAFSGFDGPIHHAGFERMIGSTLYKCSLGLHWSNCRELNAIERGGKV